MDGSKHFPLESMFAIKAWIFPVWYFLGVASNESMYSFAFGHSSTLWNSLAMLFINSFFFFCYDLSVPIFCSKILFTPLHPVVGLSSHFFLLLADRVFVRCFGRYCFVCNVWSCHGIFLIFFLSTVPSDLSNRVVSFVVVWFFPLCPNISFLICLMTFACCRRFLIWVSNLSSHPNFAIFYLFFSANRTFSLAYFAPTYIRLFSSMMLLISR